MRCLEMLLTLEVRGPPLPQHRQREHASGLTSVNRIPAAPWQQLWRVFYLSPEGAAVTLF